MCLIILSIFNELEVDNEKPSNTQKTKKAGVPEPLLFHDSPVENHLTDYNPPPLWFRSWTHAGYDGCQSSTDTMMLFAYSHCLTRHRYIHLFRSAF